MASTVGIGGGGAMGEMDTSAAGVGQELTPALPAQGAGELLVATASDIDHHIKK